MSFRAPWIKYKYFSYKLKDTSDSLELFRLTLAPGLGGGGGVSSTGGGAGWRLFGAGNLFKV